MKIKLLSALLLSCTAAFGQISGQVTDEKNHPLPGAVIRLFDGVKPTRVVLTDSVGYFSFNNTDRAIIVSYTGYFTDTIKTKSVMAIQLRPDTKLLKDVNIQARQPFIRQATDRIIITVNDQIRKSAANALEVINLAPGLAISDNEDAILMSGKTEVQVLLNEKVVKLTPRDLAKMLKAMPSGSITAVEVMSNPPAKYDVSGNTGIINIKINTVLKGFNGNIDYSTSQSTYNWSDLTSMLNYGSGKFAMSGYGGWHTGGYLTNNIKVRELTDGALLQRTSDLDKWSDPVFRLTVDYQLSKRSAIGGLIEREASTNTATYDVFSQIDQQPGYQTTGRSPYVQHWNTYNLNYRYNDATGNELTADLDRAAYARNNHTEVITTGQVPLNYFTLSGIDINTFKTDYTHSWKSKLKAETGLKVAGVHTRNDQNGNRFFYQENISAAYGSLSQDYGKWGIQAGLRAEQTSAKGIANSGGTGENIRPDTNYFNLLPSVYLSYASTEKNNFRLSFSRRIKRPDYHVLQPITYQLDPLNYQTGNPGLRAQCNELMELSYTYDDRISIVSSYAHTADYFNAVIQQNGNILYHTTGNSGILNTLNFDLNYPIKVNNWWNMLNKANLANDHFKGQQFQGYLDQDQWHYQFSTMQRFELPGKYLLQLGVRYTSAARNLIYYQQSSANTTASISKKIFKDQGSVKIGVSDIFKTQRNYTSVAFGTLNYHDFGTFESRRISFSFSWRFGNQKIRKTEDRERGDADERDRSGG